MTSADLIQVRNLKKHFNKGAIKALDDVSIDIKSIIPTNLIVSTIHTATIAVIIYEITFTGKCDTRAKSRSNAHAIILS